MPILRVFRAFGPSRLGLLALVAALVSGCVTVDVTLAPDGSGTITYEAAVMPGSSVEAQKALFTSPHVTVQTLTIDPKSSMMKVTAKVDDITELDSAKAFADVDVVRTQSGEDTTLTATITNRAPRPDAPEDGVAGPRITATLPGKVIEATGAKHEVSGSTVTWTLTRTEYLRAGKHVLTVRYATPKDGGAAKPAPAKP